MKIKTVLILIGTIAWCGSTYASYPVFDATNNVLASLQKAMDSAFQSVQKSNMAAIIKQAKADFEEQVKIYQECVKQYDECVRIYNQAVRTYDWINLNIGRAKDIKTFLTCGYSSPVNIQQIHTLVSSTLSQTASATNRLFNQSVLTSMQNILASDVAERMAKRGVERQRYAQAAQKVAERNDEMANTMLTALQTKDRMLESRVSSGTADMMQIVHANEQGTMFIAEELARVNSNISAINRTQARQEEALGENEMNRAQEAATYAKMEKETIDRGNSYTRQQDSRNRIDSIFNSCRVF